MTRKPFNRDEALGLLDKGYKNALLDYDLRGVDLRNANLCNANLRDANLRGAVLCDANLRDADLCNANLRGANLCNADLYNAVLCNANLRDANLRGANLCIADMRGVDLRDADLRGVDLDFSCWPLWCGGLHVRTDKRIAVQLAYHLCSLQCDDEEFIKMRNSILEFANQLHRVDECGELKPIERIGKRSDAE
jgi:uncharacterized protein YjbI with pentapeptide repeats